MTVDAPVLEPAVAAPRAPAWQVFLVLLGASVTGSVAIVPYTLWLIRQMPGTIPAALPEAVFAVVAAGIGLWLGPKVSLRAPLISALLAGDAEAPRRFRHLAPWAAGLGLAGGIVLIVASVASAPLFGI